MYTDYQAEAHFLLATGEPRQSGADALHPAPDFVTEALALELMSSSPVMLPQHPPPQRPA